MTFEEKRNKIEALVYRTFDLLDPSGRNTTKYKELLGSMSDKKFDEFIKYLLANENEYLTFEVVDYEIDLDLKNIRKAAELLKIDLFEYVAQPFVNGDTNNPPITPNPVPVGYLHIKRPQQMLTKKNTTSLRTSKRSAITGQVVGSDKSARESDQENVALLTIGADKALAEFMGPRADDRVMELEMLDQINKNGYTELDTLTNHLENKTTLVTLDVYLLGMGIKSDLITNGLAINRTINKEK